MSPTYGVEKADTLSISWNDLLKGKHLLPISRTTFSSALLFYILLTHAGLTVKNEVTQKDEAHPQNKKSFSIYMLKRPTYILRWMVGPHFRPMYGKAQKNQAQRFSEQQQRDALNNAVRR